MQIIGAGFGRTGTMSLKAALEQIGFGPCYHMLEVFKHPSHIKTWLAAAEGQEVDWVSLLGEYQAGLDYPLSVFYKELMGVYPEAKVILTVRDPQRWYESTLETIYQGAALPDWALRILPPYRDFIKMVRTAVWEGLFEGRSEERAYAINVFENWVIEVKRTVPAEKLLIFSVKDGWEPLCTFLGVSVPDKPFPHINDRKMTKRLFLLARLGGAGVVLTALALLAWVVMAVF